ncbi:MAG: MATE family efflux transporter [Bacteroidota bacterium]|nr:MATE family efflux transporter [Bacteroidota bacterium]
MGKIQLSDHFGYKKLLRYTLPSMIMMVVASVYGVVDGLFVSNFVGKEEFSSVNFIMPVILLLAALGTMFGTGGAALIAKTLGEGNRRKARRTFSLLVWSVVIVGAVIALFGFIFVKEIALLLGATKEMALQCELYGRIIFAVFPLYILQMFFQPIMSAAEKPQLGLILSIISGVLNIVLDYVLIVVFEMGLVGAALATAIAQSTGGLIPLFYFSSPNTSLLRLCKTKFDANALLKTSSNGISELISSVSMSVVSMLYNYQLMKYIGPDGVAAYGVIMYAGFIFVAIYVGFCMGSAPIIAYNYGAENKKEMKIVFHKSLIITFVFGLIMILGSQILATPLAKLFVGYDQGLFELTQSAFRIYSISFLFCGFTIYASAFFTALNNGFISALISFARTMICETSCVILIPLIFGISGIWFAIIFAEVMAVIFSTILLKKFRKKYGY